MAPIGSAPIGSAPIGLAPAFLRQRPVAQSAAAGPKLEPSLEPKLLSPNLNIRACCAAVAVAFVVAFPVAQGLSAVSQSPIPVQQVNRATKGDLIAKPRNVIHKVPLQTVKDPARPVRDQSDKRTLMDGCESSFSPVTVPSMAHIAGRCVG